MLTFNHIMHFPVSHCLILTSCILLTPKAGKAFLVLVYFSLFLSSSSKRNNVKICLRGIGYIQVSILRASITMNSNDTIVRSALPVNYANSLQFCKPEYNL